VATRPGTGLRWVVGREVVVVEDAEQPNRASGDGQLGTTAWVECATPGLAPNAHLRRPYLPDTPQDNNRDSANTGRVSGLGSK
jgi:hypothetical protein